MATPSTILVFRSAALGDFILACPALRLLRKTYPESRVVLLTMQSSHKAIRDSVAMYSPTSAIPWVELATPHLIDETVTMDVTMSLTYLFALRSKLRTYKFDMAVLMVDPGAPWTGRLKKLMLLTILAGLIPKYGWRGKGSLNGDRAHLKAAGFLPHHVYGATQFLTELDPPVPHSDRDIIFDLRPSSSSFDWARRWISEHVPPGARLVFVAPGSIQWHKRWPLEKFSQLCSTLASEFDDLFIIFIGTPKDHRLGEQLMETAGRRGANLAGQTSISQSAALLSFGCLLVGNDGGAMHLGDAMGIKVVSIVPGLQYPDSIEPWNNRAFAVRHPIACAPCYSLTTCPLGHNKCMVDLPVERVLINCRSVLLTNLRGNPHQSAH